MPDSLLLQLRFAHRALREYLRLQLYEKQALQSRLTHRKELQAIDFSIARQARINLLEAQQAATQLAIDKAQTALNALDALTRS
jgi:hypothetical protein